MTNHRLLLIFLFLSFISLGTTIAILQFKLGSPKQDINKDEPTVAPTTSQPPTNPYQVTLKIDNNIATIANITLISQDFELEDLNAYQLDLSFNPLAIKIISVSPGEIWQQTNILSNKIDDQIGNISVSIGRGFETQITNKNILTTIEYQILDPKLSPDITILGSSQLAIAGYTTSPQISVE